MPFVELDPVIKPRRGSPVVVGNVYQHPWGRPFFKIVMGIADKGGRGGRKWNNIIMLHVDIAGNVIGCSAAPETYVQGHNDLVGTITNMPKLKLKWLKLGDK